MSAELTDKEARFVEEYLIDLNATQAAIRAGYSKDAARNIAYETLSRERVKTAVEAAMAERSKRTGVTADRVIRELARIAFANMRDFADWGPGGVFLKESATLAHDEGACVQELSESRSEKGSNVRFKLYDKRPALEMLARHLGLFEKDNDQKAINVIEQAKEIQKLSTDQLIQVIEGELATIKAKSSEALANNE